MVFDLKLLGYEKTYLDQYDSNSKDFSVTLATNLTLNRVPKYVIEAIVFGGIIAMIVTLMASGGGIEGEMLGKSCR